MIRKNVCGRHDLRIAFGITMVVLLLSGAGVVRAETGLPIQQDPALPDPFQMPGRLEANGTHFELTNSSYLNITLDSSEPIKLILESVPEMVTMHIESLSGAASTQITMGGFLPLTTYHKYEDDYHNHIPFTTDATGNYTYKQDISAQHLVFIQVMPSTKFIRDDATGGDCALIGTWDTASRTCTLTTDLNQTIQIDSNGITLDGNGHNLTGNKTGSGVYLNSRTGVTIENLVITQFSYGIYLSSSNSNNLTNNTAISNSEGIYLYSSNGNTVTNNTASNNYEGISAYSSSGNNALINNTVNLNVIGIYLGYSLYGIGNTLIGNTMSGNQYNFYLDFSGLSNHNIDTSNTVDGKPVYYVKNAIDQTYGSSTNAGLFYCIRCNNVTIKDMNLTKNSYGVFLYGTFNSKVENVIASNNYNGIFLYESSSNILNNNTAYLNFYAGIYPAYSSSNIMYNNSASKNSRGIIGYQSNSNIITNNRLFLNDYAGIELTFSSKNNILIDNNVSSNNGAGITLQVYSDNNNITNNAINSNRASGVWLEYLAGNNFLTNNNIINNGAGIYLDIGCNNNTIMYNNVSNNGGAFLFAYNSKYNTLSSNTASYNNIGVYFWQASDNKVYNNLFNNTNNILADSVNNYNLTKTPGTNIIGGPYFGGNFWGKPDGTGFSQTCIDADSDGICDSIYLLDSKNIDYLPLTYNQAIAPTQHLKSIMISPPTTSLTTGGTQQFNATALDQNNNPMVGINISWTISNSSVGGVTPLFAITGSDGNASALFTATAAGNAFINATNGSITGIASITVNKASQIITFSALSNKTYGDPPFVVNATASSGLPVSFTASGACSVSGSTVTITGAGSCTITASQSGNSSYNPAPDVSQTFNIVRATPTIIWANPADIVYGTALSGTQLDATASVSGSFVYSPPSGAILGAGTQILSTLFTPTDMSNYTTASASVTIRVNQATPEIIWNNPANITEGTPLNSTQLDATASVSGSFIYTPSSGAVLGVGMHTLHVDFAPADTANYTDASKDVSMTVINIPPTVTINPSYFATIPITLRIAGQGAVGNSVELEVIQDGKAISNAMINSTPGSPNKQEANLSATIDLSKNYSGRLIFDTGADISGGTPVWVIIDNVTTKVITFNTQKNKISSYHQTYNLSLAPLISIVGKQLSFNATASDPGSETLSFNWNFGDGGVLSNSYPWPHSIAVTDAVKHSYLAAGSYIISLNVTDGNGGEGTTNKTVVIS